jgi:predicted pore-forming effector associated with SMODS systems
MYKMVEFGLLIKIITLPAIILFFMFLSISDYQLWIGAIRSTLMSVFLISLLIGMTPLWRWIWKKTPILNNVIYPDINGVWRGSLSSNWTRIEPRLKSNAVPENISSPPLLDKTLQITIRCNWFWMSMRMETGDNYSESQTLSLIPVRSSKGKPHELHYIYHNQSPEPVETDSSDHYGAAILKCKDINTTEPKLLGHFWTNRNWAKGLNTAGIIEMKRISDNPDDSLIITK